MTFTLFWIICVVYAGLGLIGVEAWDLRHNSKTEPTTLKDIIVGIGFILCPVINVFVCVDCTIYAFFEITPKIVLFKPKPRQVVQEHVKVESEVQL